jgi:hypothetical protein
MIEEGRIYELLVNRIEASKRIRVDSAIVKETVAKLLQYINVFNAMDEYQDRVLDANLDTIKVIGELAPFIEPSSVRLDPNDVKTSNLLVEWEEVDASDMSVNEFHDLEAEFRKWFKKDASENVETLDHLRVAKSFNDVLPRMAIELEGGEWWTKFDSAPFIPVPLDASKVGGLFRDMYFSATVEDMIEEYFKPLVF